MPLAPPGTDAPATSPGRWRGTSSPPASRSTTAPARIRACASRPDPNAEGVIVTWTQHDAAEAVFGYGRPSDLQEQMNYALADVLTMIGYPVEGFGQATAHLVTGPKKVDEAGEITEGGS